MSKPVIVLGGGGHAKVLVGVLRRLDADVLGLVDPNKKQGSLSNDCNVLGDDDAVLNYSAEQIELVNGIGSLPRDGGLRERLFWKFLDLGYRFKIVVDPSAIVLSESPLAEGCQVMAGVIIQTGVKVSENCIINSGAIVEHDCRIGAYTHVAPGATLSGGVTLAERVHVGTGAVLIQNVEVGANSIIGAGAVVTKNVPENSIVYPARAIMKTEQKS